MVVPGDIVHIFAPIAGKKKYHVCVCGLNENGVAQFLFFNSGGGYQADFVLPGDVLDCLPVSPTGKSIISCSIVVRYTANQLKQFDVKVIGKLPNDIGVELIEFLKKNPALNGSEKRAVVNGLMTTFSSAE